MYLFCNFDANISLTALMKCFDISLNYLDTTKDISNTTITNIKVTSIAKVILMSNFVF